MTGIAADGSREHAVAVPRDWTNTSLGERVRYIAEIKKVSLNKLGERAGLASSVISRLSRTKGEVHRSPETLDKLAGAWGVSVEWLTYGRGQPEQTVPVDERYPHRAEAARIALDGGIEPEAVKTVLEEQIELERDPSILWWLRRIEIEGLRLREPAISPKLPTTENRSTRSTK